MPDLIAIGRALDFVEANLQEAITVADMAAAAGYSLYHFCRTFNEATHHTPYDYLMRRRLAEAAKILRATEQKIIDVAQTYRFDHPETFSRAFKRVMGTTPSQWREESVAQSQGLLPRLTPAHLRQINKGPYLRPSPVEMGPLRLAGLMSPAGDEPETVASLWDLFGQEMSQQQPAGNKEFYGLVQYTAGWQAGDALYLAGVECPAPAPIPPLLMGKELPALTYARFVHKGPRCNLPFSLDYFYYTWLPRSGHCLAQPWVLEQYGPHLPHPDDEKSEITISIPIESLPPTASAER